MMSPHAMRSTHFAAGVLNAIAFVSSGVHLLLSASVRPAARPAASRLQWTGTALLIVSSTLLISAFVFEPIGGRGRTAVSAFGIFTLAAGVILHVSAGRLGRER